MPPMKSFTIDLGEKPPDPEEVGSLYHLSLSEIRLFELIVTSQIISENFQTKISHCTIVMSIVQID